MHNQMFNLLKACHPFDRLQTRPIQGNTNRRFKKSRFPGDMLIGRKVFEAFTGLITSSAQLPGATI